MEKYPDKIRRVIYLDKESKKKFIFFTNALTISPLMVAELYHNRWQIELFFKWIEQHLKIKKFWGYLRKCSPHSDLLCDHSLLYDGYSAEKDEHRALYLRDTTDCKCLINRHNQPYRPLCKT